MLDIAIIDYGSGNVRSAQKAFLKAAENFDVHASVKLTNNLDEISKASHLVLPGVGAFADCAAGIQKVEGLWPLLNQRVIKDGVPFLGICVGMQLLALEGHEYHTTKGFGWIDGLVRPIMPKDDALKIPHMGWNKIYPQTNHPVFKDLQIGEEGQHAYFVHSYHMEVSTPSQCIATTDYGGAVTAIVGQDNYIGTQFHPEKSQALGLKFIQNFMAWRP